MFTLYIYAFRFKKTKRRKILKFGKLMKEYYDKVE